MSLIYDGSSNRDVIIQKLDLADVPAVEIECPREFKIIKVQLNLIRPATDNQALHAHVRPMGASAYVTGAGSYSWAYNSVLAGTGAVVASSASDTKMQLALSVGNEATENAMGEIIIMHHAQQSGAPRYPRVFFKLNAVNATPGYVNYEGSGLRLAEAEIDRVRLVFAAGNVAACSAEVSGLIG